MTAFLAGFAISLSLIVAIGAQNAFVLRQGLRGRHVGAVILTCVLSDSILIMAGVAGFGILIEANPEFAALTRWGGAIFLIFYGVLSLGRAIVKTETLEAGNGTAQTLRSAVLTCLALTWLNPHVYLDTLVLLGAVAAQYGPERWLFGAGAVAASAAFFTALGYGAALLQPVFARPIAWRILDVAVALLMFSIAAILIIT